MEVIDSSSAKIEDIISTIDGIVFQTDLLAPKAAVESARACEQGRGFAVVANEVRTLAQRSAQSAQQVKELITESVEQVNAGTSILHRAEVSIESILTSSQQVDQLLGRVATAAQERNLGVSDMGQSIQQLDDMTQQNAAPDEQTSAGVSAMMALANTLAAAVANFRLAAGDDSDDADERIESTHFDFEQAIDAHRQWKIKLRKAIANRETLDADRISQDDQCPLGQWIHEPGTTQWSHRQTYDESLNAHARFHQIAGHVARKINAGQYDQATKLIEAASTFAEMSGKVASVLTSAKRAL